MSKMDFSGVDLNLLKLLNALLKERSVTRAAQVVGISQPAASRALGRLRLLLNDKLVVRTSKGLELTPRAYELADPVAKLLEDAQSIITPTIFEPTNAFGRFTIAAIDHMTLLLMPNLISRLTQLAPNMDIEIPPPQGNNTDLVSQRGADLAIGVYDDLPARFHRRSLYDEDLVCVVRRNHPVVAAGLTLERFIALKHLVIIITGHGKGAVDKALELLGLSRKVTVRLPHFVAAPMLIAESDMILSLPRRLAYRMAEITPIEVLELPLDTGSFTLSMIWHERRHNDPAHIWLRNQIVDTVKVNLDTKF